MAPTVVLLHGFTHTGASWDPVVAALAESYRVLAPDLRGHGRASNATPVSLPAVLSDLTALSPSKFTLVGYSMGGRIALHLALSAPDRVNRLILIGASPGIADAAECSARRESDERLASEFEQLEIQDLSERWASTPVLSGQPREVSDAVHADRLRNKPVALARALRGLGTGALAPVWGRLGELTMPVTLLVGERDRKFVDIAVLMAQRISQAEVVIVPGVGHAAHLEAPHAVADVIAGDPSNL
jgi:2-succinyl-6-hydroxy-2,4-cyclohexadiene-1-carboxylate synthase